MERSFEIKRLALVRYYEVILVVAIIPVESVTCKPKTPRARKRAKRDSGMANLSFAGPSAGWDLYNLMLDADNDSALNVTNGTAEEGSYCGEWEAAQHNLFQFSNLCFVSAFLAPRTYKPSVLLLRALLSTGFFISAAWAGVHVCLFDAFLWNMVLGFLNAVHTLLLIWRFCPPALSLELTELYVRVFKPLKVSKKHFKELTREVTFHQISEQETYAIEETTPADEQLSILLRGRLRVTCGGTHLHFINCYQFIDSPEWEANNQTDAQVFQVTITAEEESSYLSWSRLKLDRVLRHRPQLRVVFSHIIGKDITQKLYCLNEQVGQRFANDAQSRAVKEDLWRNLNRSVSVDAVNTGTHGHVRSTAWHKAHQAEKRKSSILSDYMVTESPDMGQQRKCWIPVVASQFPATSPFTHLQAQESEPLLSQEESERQPLISPLLRDAAPTSSALKGVSAFGGQVPLTATALAPLVTTSAASTPPGFPAGTTVTLIPVIVPVPVLATDAPAHHPRASGKKQREVTFDETKL
nr:PREDICTED: uncharacterized protein LOC109044383 [Bemisia tabaci]